MLLTGALFLPTARHFFARNVNHPQKTNSVCILCIAQGLSACIVVVIAAHGVSE
jgi:hypothetical protein